MITIIFEDDIDFYFARQRVTEKLAQANTFLAAGRRAVSGPRRDGPRPDLLVHGRDRARSNPIDPGRLWALNKFYIAPQLNAAPGVADVAIVGGTPLEYQIDVRPEDLRAYGITLGDLYAAVAQQQHAGRRRRRSRRTTPSTSSAASAGFATSSDIENTVIKEVNGTPIYVKNVATVQLGTQFRRSVFEKDGNEVTGGAVLMRHGENPLAVTQARQGEDPGTAAGPAARACTSCRPTTARG